jgi:hypothetical protein
MIQSAAIALLLITLTSASSAQNSSPEAQIRSIVADQVAAWNAGDGPGFAPSRA